MLPFPYDNKEKNSLQKFTVEDVCRKLCFQVIESQWGVNEKPERIARAFSCIITDEANNATLCTIYLKCYLHCSFSLLRSLLHTSASSYSTASSMSFVLTQGDSLVQSKSPESCFPGFLPTQLQRLDWFHPPPFLSSPPLLLPYLTLMYPLA